MTDTWKNRIELFGYPIIGGWLPYVGMRRVTMTRQEFYELTGEWSVDPEFSYDAFCIEWLCRQISRNVIRVKVRGNEKP